MNDLALKADRASDAPLSAFTDQVQAMVGGWRALGNWGTARCQEMAASMGVPVVNGQGVVPLQQWRATYPWTPKESARAYVAHLREQQPWVLELEPRINDLTWLTTSTTASDTK